MTERGPFDATAYAAAFARDGYAVLPRALSGTDVDAARAAIERIPESEAVRRKRSIYGVRNLLETSAAICGLATRPNVWRFVTPVLGDSAFAVRAIFFNKTPEANWALGWHQDRVIAVTEKVETPGFSGWGRKAGVWHVQPPAEILARMLALRIHLDDCRAENGALRVIPGSHRHDWVEDQLADWKHSVPPVTCAVGVGGIVAMCPLILHASSRAAVPVQRRVIHIEYASEPLPNGLKWNRQVRPG